MVPFLPSASGAARPVLFPRVRCFGPWLRVLMACLLLLGVVFSNQHGAQAAPAPEWASNFNLPGANGSVLAVVQTADAIYIGGNFTSVGTVAANRVARYDKAAGTWSAGQSHEK